MTVIIHVFRVYGEIEVDDFIFSIPKSVKSSALNTGFESIFPCQVGEMLLIC